jgi:ribulose-5-phosphate 4-epimerase/fuculose-1-phosphate aldolase
MPLTASRMCSSWCEDVINPETLKKQWTEARDRLMAKGLLPGSGATLSVRCPGGTSMWFGAAIAAAPVLWDWNGALTDAVVAVHALAYARRADVGAIARGGGPFGMRLAGFGGALPQVFDEQARHIGPMPPAVDDEDGLGLALRTPGSALILRGSPMCWGTTPRRLALNAELFEKCAKAYVLAVATGGRVRSIPWWVRRIANGRLARDQRAAALAFGRGEQPNESAGY